MKTGDGVTHREFESHTLRQKQTTEWWSVFYCILASELHTRLTDGTWSNCWGNVNDGDSNTVFTTTKMQIITITLDTETKEVNMILSDAAEPDPSPPTEPPVVPEKPNKPGKPGCGGIFDWIFWRK